MNLSIDMFADLERTLCEEIENLNITRNREPVNSDEDIKQILINCLENVKDLSRIHGPAIRG